MGCEPSTHEINNQFSNSAPISAKDVIGFILEMEGPPQKPHWGNSNGQNRLQTPDCLKNKNKIKSGVAKEMINSILSLSAIRICKAFD